MSDYFTLQDLAVRSGNADAAEMIKTLAKANEAMDDILWKECNNGSTEVTTVQRAVPSPAWRKLNSGVPLTKGATAQLKASCGMLETYSEVDKKLVELGAHSVTGGSSNAVEGSKIIADENVNTIQGFSNEVSRSMFYGSPAKPEEPVGLSHFYNKKGDNVLDFGGSSNLTSVWLLSWDKRATTGIYPQGTNAGLKEEFLGQTTKQDEHGGLYEVYRTHYVWDLGFVPKDFEANVRIANIDLTSLEQPENLTKLVKMIIVAMNRIPTRASSYRKALYMHPRVFEAIDTYAIDAPNVRLKIEDMFGRRVTTFRGIPMRRQESLKLDETKVN